MSILRLDGVRREIGDFVILDSVTAALARGERVGLVGGNGAGKTTLLEIIAGREEADGGHGPHGQGPAHRAADPGGQPRSALHRGAHGPRDRARLVQPRSSAWSSELAELEARGAEAVQTPAYASLRERFEAADGYHLDQRVQEALAGLGIPRSHWDHKPSELSGGEQTRVALARLLVADPDLLMLDEPTNHLDIAALEWLEMTLVKRDRALLVASHDRAFLDNVVERIWELRDRRLAIVPGRLLGLPAPARVGRRAGAQHGRLDRRGHRARGGARAALSQPAQAREDARARAAPRGTAREPGRRAPRQRQAEPAGLEPDGCGTGALGRDRGLGRGRALRLSGE